MDWLTPLRELFGFISQLLEPLPIIRAVIAFLLVFFLPGFAWTLVFFKRISVIERVVISFGLSIAGVTLSLLVVNRIFGVRITGFNSALVIILITILPMIVYCFNRLIRRRKGRLS